MNKWNHYVCQECGGVTVARQDDDGVTPFTLRCRAKDTKGIGGVRAHGCEGKAESQFGMVKQDDDQKPHIIFFRPSDAAKAIEEILKETKSTREWLLDHYANGGALMREVWT